MQNKIAYAVGLLVGIAVVAVWAAVSRKKVKNQYDERQLLARGRAYRAAFYTMLLYLMADGSFQYVTGRVWCGHYAGCMLAVALGGGVFATCCIAGDAYFTLYEHPKTFLLLTGGALVALLALELPMYLTGSYALFENGMLSDEAVPAIAVVMVLWIYLACALRLLLRRLNEAKDDGDE